MNEAEFLSLWGGPATPPCFLERFCRIAQDNPNLPAVTEGHTQVSYGELLVWALNIASELETVGVLEGDRVAVSLPRSIQAVAALFGILFRGATYVPLDSGYPIERLQYIIDDCAPRALVLADHVALKYGGPIVRIADSPRGLVPIEACSMPCEPTKSVYVIYTSGSTGWPKGVSINHRCVDAMVDWQTSHSPRPDLRTAQFAPLNFDVSFQEILGTLCGGGVLAIMPEDLRREPGRLLLWLADHQTERLFLPFVALQMLAVTASHELLQSLKLVEINTAGEQLVCSDAIRSMFVGLPGCRLVNHYGQSESAMVTSHVLEGHPDMWPDAPPIGIPLPGCEVLVQPEDPESPHIGELLVAGMPLSDGYLDRPELTEQRFVTIPLSKAGHTRAFRTGDLVELTAAGLLFLSRIDDQVKIRGIRVDLLEVDTQLLADPDIVSAATAMVSTKTGLASLRAAVVLRGTHLRKSETEMLHCLGNVLPEASVPLSVTVVPELPITPSGKTDRLAVVRLIESDLRERRRSATARER